jgi:hypothetical protein
MTVDLPNFGNAAGNADHRVFVAVGFICGPNEGTARRGTGVRQFAMYMVLEGNSVTCTDNQ